MRVRWWWLILAGCGSDPVPIEAPLVDPVVLADLDPEPNIVRVEIAATVSTTEYLSGKPAEVWAYRDASVPGSRGTVPGPMLRVKQGDQVIARVTNELPEATIVHWHGIRLLAQFDGSTSVQSPILPGETFEYRFTVMDAGTFWYHSHFKADEQIERGLYAPLIVDGGSTFEVAADRTFVLDDVKLSADGALSQDTDALDVMLGRQGNVLLVNGAREKQLAVARGSRERFRFVNAANGRYFNLELEDHPFTVIGWDGGLVSEPYQVDRLLLAPGERYDVLVSFDRAVGSRAVLRTLHYDRGHDIPDPGPKDLLTIIYADEAESSPALLPARLTDEAYLPVQADTPVRQFTLKELEDDRGVKFYINDQLWPFNTPVMVPQDALEIWEIVNDAEMDHPFHVHGMFFQVVGAPRWGWKDTVNIPQKSTLRFAIRYDAPGMWMFHCHILEHAERGMMGDLMVHPPE